MPRDEPVECAPGENRGALTRTFLNAMSRVASTVCVVTTNGRDGWKGATISAMSSVSADGPNPVLLICLHRDGILGDEILCNDYFCVNILAEDQSEISDVFAGRLGHEQSARFDTAQWRTMKNGVPGLIGSVAQLGCRVTAWENIGTHYVIFGAVKEIDMADAGLPLLYTCRGYARPDPLADPESSLKCVWKAESA